MAETNSRPTPCPRCGAPITGAFKFCPTCAYRLEAPGDSPGANYQPGSRWPAALMGGLFLTLVVAIVFLGVYIFRDQPVTERVEPQAERALPRGRLTVRDHLPELFSDLLVRAPAANLSVDPDVPELVYVKHGIILRVEVTRGMYLEFLEDLEKRRSEGRPWPAYMAELEHLVWRPVYDEGPKDGERRKYPNPRVDAWWKVVEAHIRADWNRKRKEYAQGYVDEWWRLVEEHLRAHEDENGDDSGADIVRPADLKVPLPERYDALLLTPPSWIYITRWQELARRLPANTERLPVTEVSWYEGIAFSAWVNDEHGLGCRLPGLFEWLRAGNGGNPDKDYPWGDDGFFQGCNSRNHWGPKDEPRLRPVDFRYSDDSAPTMGARIYSMSGNAREWCLNPRVVRKVKKKEDDEEGEGAEDKDGAAKDEDDEAEGAEGEGDDPMGRVDMKATAPTCGGSYLLGIGECRVRLGSVVYEEKIRRFKDVGFRLWADTRP